MSSDPEFIVPDWPAPPQVRALSTTRGGGFSNSPWNSLNLGDHVGDDHSTVEQNRLLLAERTGIPRSAFHFLDQVHGTDVVQLPSELPTRALPKSADGCVTSQVRTPCLIMAADCLPVLFCNRDGTRVGAAHAGWRGLCQGVLEQTVAQFDDPESVMAWLGPAIGPRNFEVGPEVFSAFVEQDDRAREAFVQSDSPGHYLADLYLLARQRLKMAGVKHFYGGKWCTFADSKRFFSYRRDGVTGRMATLIFLDS